MSYNIYDQGEEGDVSQKGKIHMASKWSFTQ